MAESLLVRKAGGGAKINGTEKTFIAQETILPGDIVVDSGVIESVELLTQQLLVSGQAYQIRYTTPILQRKNHFMSFCSAGGFISNFYLVYWKVNDDLSITTISHQQGSIDGNTYFLKDFYPIEQGIKIFYSRSNYADILSQQVYVNPETGTFTFSAVNTFVSGSNAGITTSKIINESFDNYMFIINNSSNNTIRQYKIYQFTETQTGLEATYPSSSNHYYFRSNVIATGREGTNGYNLYYFAKQVNSFMALYKFVRTTGGSHSISTIRTYTNNDNSGIITAYEPSKKFIGFYQSWAGSYRLTYAVFNDAGFISDNAISSSFIDFGVPKYVERNGDIFKVYHAYRNNGVLVIKTLLFDDATNTFTVLKDALTTVLTDEDDNTHQKLFPINENTYLIADGSSSSSGFNMQVRIFKTIPRIKKGTTEIDKNKIIGVAKNGGNAGDTITVLTI